jgi:hypothetical protein
MRSGTDAQTTVTGLAQACRRVCRAVFLGSLASGCHSAVPRPSTTGAPVTLAPGIAHYHGQVVLRPALGAVDGNWSIRVARRAGPDSIAFLLSRTLTISSASGSDVIRVARDSMRGLSQVTLHLAPRNTPGESTVTLHYSGPLEPSDDRINTLSANWVELGLDSFWLPIVADLEHDIVGEARVVLPPGYRLVSSGAVVQRGDTSVITYAQPMVDIALSASPTLATVRGARSAVHGPVWPTGITERILRVADECATYLNQRYGAQDAIRAADIVLPQRSGPGYARRQYIVIPLGTDATAASAAEDRTHFICHELAHYWSSGAGSSGPDNWLNEGMAEFVSGRAVRTLRGDSAFALVRAQWARRARGQGPVWTAASTARPPAMVSYGKAPLLLDSLERRIGARNMERVLTRFMTDRTLRTTLRVLTMLDEEGGAEAGTWFRESLSR